MAAIRSGLTPTLISRPSMFSVASLSALTVKRVLMKP